MCGIAGLVDTSTSMNQENLQHLAQKMADSLRHRGPDAQHAWAKAEDGIALGHARLSILDLSDHGAQPMPSPSGRYMIAYNGEIYNHNTLRECLKNEHQFNEWNGHGDTETLAALIDIIGIENALIKCHGMFALAVWDHQEKTLTLARDRAGEKPLYFGLIGEHFAFASELSPLKHLPTWEGRLDGRAIGLFLQLQHIPAPYSIYENIHKLEPAHLLTFSPKKKKWKTKRYWELPVFDKKQDPISIDTLHKTLVTSVTSQMQSDVPLGVLLSGGIDSSLIASIMQQQSIDPIHSFTIGFTDAEGFDESTYAKKIARHLGTNHTEVMLSSQDALDVIPSLPDMYDEPFADASQIPTYLISKAARQHVTVALSGDGGDEMLGGYRRYVWSDRIQTIHRFCPRIVRWWVADQLTSVSFLNRILLNLTVKRFIPQWEDKAEKFGRLLSCNGSDFYHVFTRYWDGTPPLIKGVKPYDMPLMKRGKAPLPEWMMRQDFHSYLPNDVLTKVDRASMAVGLEMRAPFLDVPFIEACSQLPLNQKIHGRTTKWAARKMLERYLPEHLYERPKMGFAIPLADWLRGPLKEWAESLLDNDRLLVKSMINKETVSHCWRAHCDKHKHLQQELWTILVLLSWIERHHAT